MHHNFRLTLPVLFISLCSIITGCSPKNLPLPEGLDDNIIWAISPSFENGHSFSNGCALVELNDESFFINKNGDICFDQKFDSVQSRYRSSPGFRNGIAIIQNDDKLSYLFRNGTFFPFEYTETHSTDTKSNSLSLVQDENGLYGYMNLQDLWYIEPTYLDGEPFQQDISIVRNEYERIQHFVKNDGTLIDVDYQYYISDIAGGFAAANSRAYVSTETGEIIIPGPFQDTGYFSDGLAPVKVNDYYGYIDTTGKMIISPQFISADEFSEGLARVTLKSGKFAFISMTGNIKYSLSKGVISDRFRDGYIWYSLDKKNYGLLNNDFECVLKPQYDRIKWSNHGFYWLYDNGALGIFNPSTNTITSPFYEKIYPITSEIAITELNGLFGLLNYATGESIIAPSFYWSGEYGEGLICVQHPENNKYGYMDYFGNWVISPVFDSGKAFSEGLAPVSVENQFGYIANPLYYSKWSPDEVSRAEILGLKKIPSTHSPLDCSDFWTFLCQHDNTLPPLTGTLTRENAAILITEYAAMRGEETNCFLSNIPDVSASLMDSFSCISYATSIGVFDFAEDGSFSPKDELSNDEAIQVVVRLFEYMLDTDGRTHPERMNLITSSIY